MRWWLGALLGIAACAPPILSTTDAAPTTTSTTVVPRASSTLTTAPTISSAPGSLAGGLGDVPLATPAGGGVAAISPSYLIPVGLVKADCDYLALMGYDDDPAERGMTLWAEESGTWTMLPEPLFTDLGLGLAPPGPIATSLVAADAETWFIYGWGSQAGEEDTSSIWGATAPELTGPWVAMPNQVLGPGEPGTWDDGGVMSPSVVRIDGGFVMLYDGWSAPPGDRVGLATSSDGITWQRANEPVMSPGPAGTFDARSIQIPRLARSPEGWMMAYMALEEDTTQLGRVGLAVSQDLLTWTKLGVGLQASDVSSEFGVHTIALDFWEGELSLLAEVLGATESKVWQATSPVAALLPAG